MKKVLTVVVFLLMSIGAWAGEVIIKPSNGGSVVPSSAGAGETCTLTVTPDDGYYLKSLTAVTTVDGSAIQAPARRAGTGSIEMDETELTITSDSNADPSGETTHTFTMPSDGNFNVEVTAEFEARINISDAVITLAATSFTYDGTEKEPAVSSVEVGGTPLNANEFSVSYSNNINVSAAVSPTVTVTGLRQYTGTATATFTISPKSITSDMITLSANSFVYNGNKQVPTVTVKDGDVSLIGDDYDISFELVNENEDPIVIEDEDAIIDVATYNVVLTGKGNYTGSATQSFEITKAPLSLIVSLDGWTYGATANTPTVSGNVGQGGATYYYKVKGAEDEPYAVYPGTQTLNAGEYTIKVEVAETANYASGSATNDFTIDRAALPVGGENGLKVTLAGWTYGAQHAGPAVSGNLGNGEVTYTYKVNKEEVAEFTETEPTNAGSYIVKASVAQSVNYLSAEAQTTFDIEKADITGLTITENEELVYDGEVKQLVTVSGVPEGATVKYYFKSITEDDFEDGSFNMICEPNDEDYRTTLPTGTNAGYFGIVYMVDGGNNYNKKEATVTMKVAIYPAEITELTIDETPLVYTGESQEVNITGVYAGTIKLTANDYTVSYKKVIEGEDDPAPQDAPFETGTYNVIVTGQGNFAGSKSASFTIINRTLSADEVTFHEGWATYCSLDEDVNLPAGIGAYVATGLDDGVVTLTQISYIPTEVPVLLNNATTTTTSNTEFGFNLLQYAPEAIVVDDAKYYGLYNGKFMRVTGTIPAGRVYLYAQEPNASQLTIVIDNEDNFTSVNDVKIKMNEVDGNIYDLTGRKLQNLSKKGLYIQNGRKVVVK